MRFVSFNIRDGGGSRVEKIQKAIAGHDPDVLILLEFRNNAAGTALRLDLSLVEEFGKLLGCGWTDVWCAKNPGVREWSWVEPWGRHVG